MDKETEKVSLDTIPLDALADFKFSGAFHQRVLATYFNFASKFEETKFHELCFSLEEGGPELTNDTDKKDADSIKTLLVLIRDMETSFKDKGLFKKEEFDVPTEGSAS